MKKTTAAGKATLRHIAVVLMTVLLICMTTSAICGVAFAVYINEYVNPNLDVDLGSVSLNLTSTIYYKDSKTGDLKELEILHGSENRIWANIDEIPKKLQDAFISVEDARFRQHNGVDWKRTIGAALNYVLHFRQNFGGGSTITQQLIKNLTGQDETSVKRKVQEIMRALELEKQYKKDEILELYLNTIYLGQGAYGVKQAAQAYFNKDLNELTTAECAAIAGITKNPYKYDLIRFPEYNDERRLIVLGEMKKTGAISEEEYNTAVAEKVTGVRGSTQSDATQDYQSYFVDAIIDSLIKDLMEQKGYSESYAKTLIYNGGLSIISTIDVDLQNKMDQVFKDVDNFPGVLGNDGSYPQASMVLMDQKTGYVKALYGGRGEKTGDRVLNRATQTYRSPGSSIKPITVYAPAMEYGVATPITVVDDAPKSFTISPNGWPKNENGKYRGLTTIANGIAQSLNTVAVDTLQKVGINRSFSFATKNLGLTSLVERMVVTNKDGSQIVKTDKDISPLALGGLTKGVNVIEMTAAYSAFANNGIYTNPVLYTAVYDANNNEILSNTPVSAPAMSAKTATYMVELLSGVVKNGTGTGAALGNIEVAGKTGTSQGSTDRWFAGFTPYYTGVVWFGYDIPQDITGVSSNPALKLWKQVMSKAHEGLEAASLTRSVDLVSVDYCLDSGLLPTDACRNDVRGSRIATAKLAPEDVPTAYCTCHVSAEIDSSTGMLSNNFCPIGSLKTVGLLNLQRAFPVSSIIINDQAFTMPYTVPAQNSSGQALFAPGPDGYKICTTHNYLNDGNATKPPNTEDPTLPPGSSGSTPGNSNNPNKPNDPTNPDSSIIPEEPTSPDVPENIPLD